MDATPVAQPAKRRLPLLIGGAVIGLAFAIALGAYLSPRAVKDLSGVWKSASTGQVYVLDKQEDDYRLTVGGHRLPVQHVDVDTSHGQLNLTVKTDSGLRAVWTFSVTGDDNPPKTLHLDQDGFQGDDLQFQRALTATDKTRISRLKPAKQALWSPGFSCEKAASDIERMICTDKNIADMDADLSRKIKGAAPDMLAEQKQWLKEVRDTCTDINCLRDSYATRLDAVAEAANAVDPDAEAVE